MNDESRTAAPPSSSTAPGVAPLGAGLQAPTSSRADDAPGHASPVTPVADDRPPASPADTSPVDSRADDEREEGPRPGFTVNDRRFWALDQEQLAAEDARPKLPSYVEQLKQQAEEKDQQLREYIAAYKKEVGEGLDKTKQRLERESTQRLEQLRGQLVIPMMEVLEALERSLLAAETTSDPSALLQGVKMVHLLMVQKLQEIGVARLETTGQPFDPARHEAVAVVPVTDASQDNTVIGEFRPGFMLGDRVIRAAQVQVGQLPR